MATNPDFLTGFNARIDGTDFLGFGQNSGAGTSYAYGGAVARAGGSAVNLVIGGTASTSVQWTGPVYSAGFPFTGTTCVSVGYVRFSSLNFAAAGSGMLVFGLNPLTGGGIGGWAINDSASPTWWLIGKDNATLTSFGGTGNSGVSVVANQWYRLEIVIDATTLTYSVGGSVSLDDDTVSTVTPTTQTYTGTSAAAQAFRAQTGVAGGMGAVRPSWNMYITDYAQQTGTTTKLGPISVLGYSPDSVGTHNLDAATSQFFFKDLSGVVTALTTSETTSYQAIDEVPFTGDSAPDAVKVTTALGSPNTPALRGAGTAVFNVNSVANPTTLTPVKNASTVNGDVMVCITFCRSITATCATPAGWSLVSGFPKTSGTASGGRMYAFTRTATGSDTCTVTWTGVTTGTTGDSSSAAILSYSNATETFEAVSGTTIDLATTNTVTLPSVTTTTDKDFTIAAAATFLDSAQSGTVTTFTERVDSSTTNGSGQFIYIADLVKTPAGATGTGTLTRSVITSARSFGCTIAFKASLPVTQPTNTWYAEYGYADETTLGAPYAVSAIVQLDLESATSSLAVSKLFDQLQGTNTENIQSTTLTTTSVQEMAKTFKQRPNTGGAWTNAAFNALRLRFGFTNSASGVPRLSASMLEAAFAPATPAAFIARPLEVLGQAVKRGGFF